MLADLRPARLLYIERSRLVKRLDCLQLPLNLKY